MALPNPLSSGLRSAFLLVLSVCLLVAASPAAPDLTMLDTILAQVHYRNIGPSRQSGRIVDFAVHPEKTHVFYVAVASAGVWKTVNNGQTFEPIFDGQPVYSIGDLALAPSDPEILWVGTGEANNSRSSYWGNGVYKSTDGGKTFEHLGLEESHHIGRIVIHPANPDIVYVAALGHLYSENEERGLFRTSDGGRTWTKSLDVIVRDKHIGVFDVVMDPSDPQVLYAAAYDKVRRPWTFNEAGPGSGIYKSTDGGDTWAKLERGLPGGMLGKIGLAVAPSDSNRVYAIVENANSPGVSEEVREQELRDGVPPSVPIIGNVMYRSDDAGATWRQVSPEGEQVGGGTPYYYAQVRVDAQNPDHVFTLSTQVDESIDGGSEWRRPFRFGGDNHALWLDPNDPQHMMLGYDHGMGITYDGGQNWHHPDNQSLAQFYAIGLDNDYPYNVYGGLQDNGSVKGPSTRRGGGPIPFEAWERVGGGDGMYNVVDPSDSRWLYNESQFGPIRRLDQKTGESRSIRYERPEGQEELRWNWNAPILISPHDSNVIYHGANVLLRSPFRGESWEEISPDLTTNDAAKIVGIGNIQYSTITVVDESPIEPGLLWVGTDDGNVWVSRNGGGDDWTRLNDRIPGNPGYWVSRVEASNHFPGTAYVTYTGYRRDDFRPFVYKTTDYGETWADISAALPDESINVIREDHTNPNLLFVGTDFGVYASIDGGGSWSSMRGDMPPTPVHDLQIHARENDLVVGTHGRGVYITDITWLQALTPEVMESSAHLFPVEAKIRWVDNDRAVSSSANYDGESEPNGIVVSYFLREPAAEAPRVSVWAGARLIREIEGTNEAGVNHVLWDMSLLRARTEAEKEAFREMQERRAQFGRGGFGGGQQADNPCVQEETTCSPAPLGTYRVVFEVGGTRHSGTTQILPDHWYE